MVERDDDHFDLDEEFVAESDESSSYEKFIDPVGRRARRGGGQEGQGCVEQAGGRAG